MGHAPRVSRTEAAPRRWRQRVMNTPEHEWREAFFFAHLPEVVNGWPLDDQGADQRKLATALLAAYDENEGYARPTVLWLLGSGGCKGWIDAQKAKAKTQTPKIVA